jgi:hypothetical protein
MKPSSVKIESFQEEDHRPFRHLAELTALNRALEEYLVPQKPEAAEVEMETVTVRRHVPRQETRGDSSRF